MTVDKLIEGSLHFKHFPGYALFLKNNHLEDLVKEQLRIAREINVPLLKFFDSVPEAALIKMSVVTTGIFLDFIISNKAEDQIANSVKQWLENQLPEISREQVAAEDITLVSFMRKESLLVFLPLYTIDVKEIIEIIREIDRYIVKSETVLTNTYINLFKESLAEETYFKDRISDTSPGVIFVFDMEKWGHVYINKKFTVLYGHDLEELKQMGDKIYDVIIHPEDLHSFKNRYEHMLNLKDGEVRTIEYRLKNKEGEYRWMRNYESVFKRSSNGLPIQMIGIALNIDSEKKTAEALEHSREQLLEAQELAEMGSFEWDLVKDKSENTPQIQRIFELANGSRLTDFLDRVHPGDRQRLQQALNNAMEINGNYDCEYRYILDDREKILWSRGLVHFENDRPIKMKGTVMDVTERHHMLQQLQRSERFYKQAQALSHLGNWIWEIKTNKVSWTDELYRIFGLEPQSEVMNMEKFFQFIHPEDREQRKNEMATSLISHQPDEYEFRIITAEGSIKILNGKAEVLLDSEGKPYKIFGTCQDVTQQKITEKQLVENQNFIRKIADATPSIISAYNTHSGKYLFINKAFEKILGYKREDLLEQGVDFLINLIHPDDLLMLNEKNTRALMLANQPGYTTDHEIIVEFTYRLRHKNGSYRWLQTYGTIFERNEHNEVETMLNISADITEMLETENKLKEQEHFIDQVADASPTVLYLFDVRSASIKYINKEIENVLGYKTEEVINLGNNFIQQIYHPEDAAEMLIRLKEYNLPEHGKSLFQFECRLKNKKEEWCWFLVREVVFLRNKNGKVVEVLGAALDISKRKAMEDTLFNQTIALQQSNTSLEEFAYVASHDLKEPLRKISTFSDRLLSFFQPSMSPDAQNYLVKIIDSSRRMQQLIDDLLSISMIAGDKNFSRHSLKDLANEALQTLEHKIEEKNAIILVQELPEATVIPSQFRQLFQNLLSNSLKFSRNGQVPEISISYAILRPFQVSGHNLSKAGRYLQITVTDNGIGFEKVFAEKIFTIFQRLHNRTQYEGTGIGLAICKRIVENHGGVIFASGMQEGGSIFTIIIPHTLY